MEPTQMREFYKTGAHQPRHETAAAALLSGANNHALLELAEAMEDIPYLIYKGTALAHLYYAELFLRPRADTDLWIHEQGKEEFFRRLEALGYLSENQNIGTLLSYQAAFRKEILPRIYLTLDVHWRLFNVQELSGLLSFEEALAESVELSPLKARTLCLTHALLVSLVHRVAHRQNRMDLLPLHDIHLMLEQLSEDEATKLVVLAHEKKVIALCQHGIELSRASFGTELCVPLEKFLSQQEKAGESSSLYLYGRKSPAALWLADLRFLPWSKKLRYLWEHAFPAPLYMRRKYGFRSHAFLPYFYFFRLVRGAGKIWKRAG
ncbi:MAG TPA: nucleotidyltransferase family protein [Bdellovibrionota bacterium]